MKIKASLEWVYAMGMKFWSRFSEYLVKISLYVAKYLNQTKMPNICTVHYFRTPNHNSTKTFYLTSCRFVFVLANVEQISFHTECILCNHKSTTTGTVAASRLSLFCSLIGSLQHQHCLGWWGLCVRAFVERHYILYYVVYNMDYALSFFNITYFLKLQ